MNLRLPLPLTSPIPNEAYKVGLRSSGESHGVVLTKPHVVELILDIAKYTPNRNLTKIKLLEPACGEGAFLVEATRRLLSSADRFKIQVEELEGCISAYDIDGGHVEMSRSRVASVLVDSGVTIKTARKIAANWVSAGDFLLADLGRHFDCIVGNPPYIRTEQLSPLLLSEYRHRFSTWNDRADIYIAFFEKGLLQLAPKGILCYICADRWTVNQYGSALRALVTENFSVKSYIDLKGASPFESDVSAYPSIVAIGNEKQGAVNIIKLADASPEACGTVMGLINDTPETANLGMATRHSVWFRGSEPWIVSSPDQLAFLRLLESKFEPIENTAKVGIGVATGKDRVFIVTEDADIEKDRLLPLVMRSDIRDGRVHYSGRFVINTFESGGGVIDLRKYPRLKRYFETYSEIVADRNIARRNSVAWFRTIDRVYPEFVKTPKLLIPDIAGANEVAFDPGSYYPHHNLYHVSSDKWDIEVLGALLSSRMALFFIWSYATKMRGGYLRFQAQYLRRIHLPLPESLPMPLRSKLRNAFRQRNFDEMDALAEIVYGVGKLPFFDFVDTRMR